jgi:hypothetical protein
MTCKLCSDRGKTWEGGDPTCSFPDGGPFNPDGWNCATAGAIRGIIGRPWNDPHTNVDARYLDDDWYATIKIDGVDLPSGSADALWVAWYKNRGRTEAMWLLSRYDPPRQPTEADCAAIIAALAGDEQSDEVVPLSYDCRHCGGRLGDHKPGCIANGQRGDSK